MKFTNIVGAGALIGGSVNAALNTQPWNNQFSQVGKEYRHEHIDSNINEKCFTTNQVASCDDGHVATISKLQRVDLHCFEKSNPLALQFQREADQGRELPLQNKSRDLQAYVEVPVHCEKINTEEKRWRKEVEKTPEQRIHLIESQEDEEAFLFQHRPWTNEFEDQEQQQRYLATENSTQKWNNQQNDRDSVGDELDFIQQDNDFNFVASTNRHVTMHRILRMRNDQFDQFMDYLKTIAHSKLTTGRWNQQLDYILPNIYSNLVRQFYENFLEERAQTQQEKNELYDQLKQAAKRIYAFCVVEVLQMKQLNQVNEKDGKQIINKAVRKLWKKIQKELSPRQIEEVRQIADKAQQQKQQVDRLINDSFIGVDKKQMQNLENDFTKVLIAGLKMINHNNVENQVQSVEFRKFHGQKYDQQFINQLPRLYQSLVSMKDSIQNQQWNN